MSETVTEESTVTAKQRYVDYSTWLKSEKGLDVDPLQAQIAVTRYHEFQRSDLNKTTNAERKAAKAAEREARSAGSEERKAAAELKRQEREQVKAEREAAKVAKAEAKAARDAERSAADASAPKGKRSRKGKETASEALAAADGAQGEVTFAAEGSKREGSEELAEAAAY